MDVPILFLKTIALRPYVFIFLLAFFVSGVVTMGRVRTVVFFLSTWMIAFLSEFSSTRNGFPYGLYHYTEFTRGEELFIFNVPFMDSLSYTFLLFASYSMALFAVSPVRVRKFDVQVADTFSIRQSGVVLLLTAVFMMMIDVVIDPVALQGDRWFLGQIYYYENHGEFFGVPLTNALGWGFVGAVATFVYQRLERRFLSRSFRDRGIVIFPLRGLFGVGLYYGVLFFILTMAWIIGERGIFLAGCFIYAIPTVLLVARCRDSRVQATEEDWTAHKRDFQLVD